MAEHRPSPPVQEAITALTLDGCTKSIDALSQLYILQDAAARRAFNMESDLRGEDIRPCDMFDIIGGTGIGGFYAVLFSSLGFTIGQAIQSHLILERRLFRSDAWNRKVQQPCVEILNTALDEIAEIAKIETTLDSAFEVKNPKTKGFVCVINPSAATTCRLIRNYRPRSGQNPQCSIRQVLQVTLSNQIQLPIVHIQDENFLSALDGYANPTHILIKELRNGFKKGTQVACLVNVGAGHPGVQLLTTPEEAKEMAGLLRSCRLVAEDVASQCHNLGCFFFRFSVSSGLGQGSCCLEDDISTTKGLTIAYLSTDEMLTQLDSLEEKLQERCGVVSIERLNSVAGKDGESRIAARLAKVERHLDEALFREVNTWLHPIHQTSKLDANIRARSGTTCQWLLEDYTFQRWMLAKHGLFWFHGLMGTGKTVMSSFIIQTFLARDDIHVAYYYFEFTNPATLSEEALFRSLIAQLAAASPTCARAFYQKHNNGGLQPQLQDLQTALNDLVTASPKPVYIIIDALDELPVGQRKYLLESLVNFSRLNRPPRTHIMTTSREEIDIQRGFESIDFELGVQGHLVQQDIAAFVDRQLEANKWTLWPKDEVEMMRRLLNERADGQFRMVACQIDILQRIKSSEQLIESLYALPKSLAETYNYILERIPEELRVQARRLFAILSFASEDISINELTYLLAVDFGNEHYDDDLPVFREKNRFHDPLDVVDLGTSLISQVEWFGRPRLQLAHASVKEHLLGSRWNWFSLGEDLAHSMVARSCLALISHIEVLQPPIDLSSPRFYSGNNWFRHVLPNGPMQLLRQQLALYATFPYSPLLSAAYFGLFDLLKTLLNTRVWEQNVLNCALVNAARSWQPCSISLQCCILLAAHNADINAMANNSFPLQAASSRGWLEIVQFFVEKGAAVNAYGGMFGTALIAAAKSRSLETVRFLVEKGADMNAARDGYEMALHSAVYEGASEIVHFLIEKGANVNAVGGQLGTVLQAAARYGSLEMVRFLVNRGVNLNAVGGCWGTALQAAARTESLEIIQFLVEKGADVNVAGGDYETTLHTAADMSSLEIVQFFVENGVSVNMVTERHGTPLDVAEISPLRSDEIVSYLRAHGALRSHEMRNQNVKAWNGVDAFDTRF
ncbi:hypothetical protein DL96DRAFT_740108 [Flagelloscypha sp. PMI_526]|nr:hypothetical protein DL96DRAFT_740108 [Flagelloscypha sp. PMI_526]